jgi:Alginate export
VRYAFLLFLLVGIFITPGVQADESITPIDPKTGKVLVSPEDSVLSEFVNSGAPNPNPPPYTILRYREDYSFLADPDNRTDFFDPIKYIPLSKTDKTSYLSFGGEIRERYENFENQGFGTHPPKDNSYTLQKIELHSDLHVNERLRFFVEGISGIEYGGDVPKAAIDQDPFDLQQAFVDYTFGDPTPNGDRLTPRVGRLQMSYGSGRLVATRAAPNIPFKFDGVQLIASSAGNKKLYAFATYPVMEDTDHFDSTNQQQGFWGVYGSAPLGGSMATSADLYYLGFRNESAAYAAGHGVEERHTVGTRLFGKKDGWDYDIEPIIQWGTFGSKDILAWTIANTVGFTFTTIPWKPRTGINFDVASGDNHKNDNMLGTFNPLFFKAAYFNDASVLRPANIIDVHPTLQFEPRNNINVTLGSDVVWRYSKEDGIYSPSGGIELSAAPGSSYVGTTAEAAAEFQLNRHVSFTLSYVHMFTSSYVKSVGGGDVNYVGGWATYTF